MNAIISKQKQTSSFNPMPFTQRDRRQKRAFRQSGCRAGGKRTPAEKHMTRWAEATRTGFIRGWSRNSATNSISTLAGGRSNN